MNSYNAWWNNQIAKIRKNKWWSSRVKTSMWGSLEHELKSFENTQRYQRIGVDMRQPKDVHWTQKCQSSHGIKIHQKVQLLESEPSKAEISCPKLLNPFRFVLTSVKMLCSGFKRNNEFAWNLPKQKPLLTVLNSRELMS